jgi:ligand-binding sensor domain-containing protein
MEVLPFGLYSPDVRCMAWDDDGMWIGGYEMPDIPGGITKWDMETETWQYHEAPLIGNLYSHNVNTIIPGGDKAVWFGTDLGLSRFDRKKRVWRTWDDADGLWSDNVTALTLSDQDLWIGTDAGINRMKLPSLAVSQVRHKSLIHRHIYFLEMDGNDVWAGTDEGIYRYQASTGKWIYVPCYEGMLVHEVTALSVTEQDIWFGTNDGIAVLDKASQTWDGYLKDHHFNAQDFFYTILADDQNVWVGTNNGVLKFVRAESRWHRYTVRDGLMDDAVRWILLEGNYVWFGSRSGINRFYWNAPYRTD